MSLSMPAHKRGAFSLYSLAKIQHALLEIEMDRYDPELEKLKTSQEGIMKSLSLSSKEKAVLEGKQGLQLTAVESGRVNIAKMTQNAISDGERALEDKIRANAGKKDFYELALKAATEDVTKYGVYPQSAFLQFVVQNAYSTKDNLAKKRVETLIADIRNKNNLPEEAIQINNHFNHGEIVMSVSFPACNRFESMMYEAIRDLAHDNSSVKVMNNEGLDLSDLSITYSHYEAALRSQGKSIAEGLHNTKPVWFSYDSQSNMERYDYDTMEAHGLYQGPLEQLDSLKTATRFFIEDHQERFESTYQKWEKVSMDNERNFDYANEL